MKNRRDKSDACRFGLSGDRGLQNNGDLLDKIVQKIKHSKQTVIISKMSENSKITQDAEKVENLSRDSQWQKITDYQVDANEFNHLKREDNNESLDRNESGHSSVISDLSAYIGFRRTMYENTKESRDIHYMKIEENHHLDSDGEGQPYAFANIENSLQIQNLIPDAGSETSIFHKNVNIKADDESLPLNNFDGTNHTVEHDISEDQSVKDTFSESHYMDEDHDKGNINIEGNSDVQPDLCNIDDSDSTCLSSETDHQNAKRYFCEICNKSFSANKSLTRHKNIHNEDSKYKHCCGLCGREFREAYNLKMHMFTHTGERCFSCEFCDKQFNNRSNLNRHTWLHTGRSTPRPMYRCALCDKTFTASGSLSRHMTLHTGERKYDQQCSQCGKEFRDIHNLKKHMVTHTGEKNFECERCGKRFTSKFSMQQHIMLIHEDSEPKISCDICHKRFKALSSLNRHKSIHDEGKKSERCCGICGAQFSDKYALKRHVQGHIQGKPHSCSVCGIAFSEAAVLKLHKRLHSE